eukprot:4373613-Pyramimonas_sp.AAC.1
MDWVFFRTGVSLLMGWCPSHSPGPGLLSMGVSLLTGWCQSHSHGLGLLSHWSLFEYGVVSMPLTWTGPSLALESPCLWGGARATRMDWVLT